jgi:phage terminase large subunit-like protein
LINIDRNSITRGQWRVLQSQEKNVLLAGGFGSGKTVALALKLLQLKHENPNAPGVILAQSWRALWSITYRRLVGVLRRNLEKLPKLVDRQSECYLDFGDGVPVFLRSAHDAATFDGLDVGWALGDEARHWPQHSHEVLLGRVRVKCQRPQIVYASTPSMGWLAAEFNSGLDKRQLICAPTSENAINLSPDYIQNLRLSYSRRMQQAVIDGLFVQLEGAVYELVDVNDLSSPWFVDYVAPLLGVTAVALLLYFLGFFAQTRAVRLLGSRMISRR